MKRLLLLLVSLFLFACTKKSLPAGTCPEVQLSPEVQRFIQSAVQSSDSNDPNMTNFMNRLSAVESQMEEMRKIARLQKELEHRLTRLRQMRSGENASTHHLGIYRPTGARLRQMRSGENASANPLQQRRENEIEAIKREVLRACAQTAAGINPTTQTNRREGREGWRRNRGGEQGLGRLRDGSGGEQGLGRLRDGSGGEQGLGRLRDGSNRDGQRLERRQRRQGEGGQEGGSSGRRGRRRGNNQNAPGQSSSGGAQ